MWSDSPQGPQKRAQGAGDGLGHLEELRGFVRDSRVDRAQCSETGGITQFKSGWNGHAFQWGTDMEAAE